MGSFFEDRDSEAPHPHGSLNIFEPMAVRVNGDSGKLGRGFGGRSPAMELGDVTNRFPEALP